MEEFFTKKNVAILGAVVVVLVIAIILVQKFQKQPLPTYEKESISVQRMSDQKLIESATAPEGEIPEVDSEVLKGATASGDTKPEIDSSTIQGLTAPE